MGYQIVSDCFLDETQRASAPNWEYDDAMSKVLLIDDDKKHSDLLQAYFKRFGINLVCAVDADEGFRKLHREDPDLILLDVMLPGKDGFEICREIRKDSSIPIIMLTARGEDTDTVLGLELGADEYVAKPVSPRVLVARLRALIRRGGAEPVSSSRRVGDLELNEQAREVIIDGQHIDLTGAEFNLIALLVRHAGKVVSREVLAEEGLGRALTAYDRRIETHMAQIRRKIGKHRDGGERIKTVRGAGYQYLVNP